MLVGELDVAQAERTHRDADVTAGAERGRQLAAAAEADVAALLETAPALCARRRIARHRRLRRSDSSRLGPDRSTLPRVRRSFSRTPRRPLVCRRSAWSSALASTPSLPMATAVTGACAPFGDDGRPSACSTRSRRRWSMRCCRSAVATARPRRRGARGGAADVPQQHQQVGPGHLPQALPGVRLAVRRLPGLQVRRRPQAGAASAPVRVVAEHEG